MYCQNAEGLAGKISEAISLGISKIKAVLAITVLFHINVAVFLLVLIVGCSLPEMFKISLILAMKLLVLFASEP